MSARSSVCANEEAKLAGLLERAAVLRAKQELELEGARIKAKLERLTLESAIAEKRAEARVLKEYEESEDGMNSYLRSHKINMFRANEEEQSRSPPNYMPVSGSMVASRPLSRTEPQVVRQRHTDNNDRLQPDKNILQVMQRQNMITEMLVHQQKQAQLPVTRGYGVQG